MKIVEELKDELKEYSGTINYYRGLSPNLLWTDGIKAMCEKANAYWITDLLASYKHIDTIDFGIVKITSNEDNSGEVTIREDTDKEPFFRHKLDYTDFPIGSFEFYIKDGIIFLKSEY